MEVQTLFYDKEPKKKIWEPPQGKSKFWLKNFKNFRLKKSTMGDFFFKL